MLNQFLALENEGTRTRSILLMEMLREEFFLKNFFFLKESFIKKVERLRGKKHCSQSFAFDSSFEMT